MVFIREKREQSIPIDLQKCKFIWNNIFQVMDMYNNEEMEYELGPKTECYVWWTDPRLIWQNSHEPEVLLRS